MHRAGEIAAQALWPALGLGALLTLVCLSLAGPLIALLGGEGETARLAERYLRISAAGLPMALLALAGQGFLRGIGDLRTPLYVIGAGQAVNVVLELLFVYGLGWGLDGSALGTFAPVTLLAPHHDWGITGVWAGLLAMMGVRLLTLGARFADGRWAVAGAVVARRGAPGAAGHAGS